MNINERAEYAVSLKNSGKYNCSQAVTAAFADVTELSEDVLKQLSAGFCAGMGNLEATCGALIGAGPIQEAFNERCGAIKCKDLKAMTDGKPLCPCDECVRNAVMICGEVLDIL